MMKMEDNISQDYRAKVEGIVRKIDYAKSHIESTKQYFDLGSRVFKRFLSRDPAAFDDPKLKLTVSQNFGEFGEDIFNIARRNYIRMIRRQQAKKF
jgi:hypothetical protein